MTIDTIAIGQAEGADLTVTMRGNAAQIVAVLVHGLPREALVQISEALEKEMDLRQTNAANDSTSPTR